MLYVYDKKFMCRDNKINKLDMSSSRRYLLLHWNKYKLSKARLTQSCTAAINSVLLCLSDKWVLYLTAYYDWNINYMKDIFIKFV